MAKITKVKQKWANFWMRFAGTGITGRLASRLAASVMPPYYGCLKLAELSPPGYTSASARIHHPEFKKGKHCFIGDRVTVYMDGKGGGVSFGDGVHLHNDVTIQTGRGGTVSIGNQTHIQPRCQISAYLESINIGSGVEIAPNCAFYSYNHSMSPEATIREQPLVSRGGIVVGNDAWLGYGVVVLDGVNIGKGAVVGAGSVVKDDIPDNAIAVGVPARVISNRNKLA